MSQTRRIHVTMVAALAATALLSGCKREPTSTPAAALFASEPFFIRGVVSHADHAWGIIVAGEPGTDYKTDKAAFRIGSGTELIRADGRAASAADIKVGTKITLWITGPIRESYPVQVDARRVLIE